MFSWSHLVTGLICIGLGIVAVKYTFQLVGYTGRQDWIESKLGSGSTYLVFKIIALLLIAFGILYAIGLWEPVGRALFSPLTNMMSPGAPQAP